jgi:hypothetical protein
MHEAEERPASTPKPRQTGVSGVLSLTLPIFGFAIAYLAAQSHQGMREAIQGFALWSLLSLVGAISAFVSLKRHGFTGTAFLGLVLCSAPFLYFLFILAINSKSWIVQ